MIPDSNEDKHRELLDLLCQAELAARNGQWATCGIWTKKTMELAFEFDEASKREKTRRKRKSSSRLILRLKVQRLLKGKFQYSTDPCQLIAAELASELSAAHIPKRDHLSAVIKMSNE